jgi:ribonuclease T2
MALQQSGRTIDLALVARLQDHTLAGARRLTLGALMHRPLRPHPPFIELALLMCLVLSLAGCLADERDTQSTPPAPATRTAMPTGQPTGAATGSAALTPTPGQRVKNTPGDFDFYVMSLSWSPDYCAGSRADDPQQCGVGKMLGFVLHGLWPQYNRGYPADCSNVNLPKDAQLKFPNLYPSSKLYTHEWDKHGTCSGLTPVEYMTLAKTLKESIAIPPAYSQPAKAFRTTADDLKAAFAEANSAIRDEALAVQCSGSGRFLKELYVCFSRAGQPIACSTELQNDETKSCGKADFLVRNVK